jgi:hypothetical protein
MYFLLGEKGIDSPGDKKGGHQTGQGVSQDVVLQGSDAAFEKFNN